MGARKRRADAEVEEIARQLWFEAFASIGESAADGPCGDLGASRPLSALDEPDCYEPPHTSPRLARRQDARLDSELNGPWD